jgi:putative FmdB family regulatory protein
VPTYEYICKSCGHLFEIVQSMRDDSLTECPECGGELRKVFAPPAIAFKGSGFYATDQRKKGATSPGDKGEKDGKTDGGDKKPDAGSRSGDTKKDSKSDAPAAGTTREASSSSSSSSGSGGSPSSSSSKEGSGS